MTLSATLRTSARLVMVVAAMAVCLGAVAAASEDRKRVAQARAQADADLAAQEAVCRQRFAVTPCLLDAREQHRAVVGPLQRDALLIDERERQQRAAVRLRRLERKAEAARRTASAAAAASASQASASAQRTVKATSPIRHRLRSGAEYPAGAGAVTAVDAGSAPFGEPPPEQARPSKRLTPAPDPSAVQRAEDRVREAEARRARVLARNAERSAKKPPAASLPVPGASAPVSSPGLVR